jgi:hypothetical protein
MQYVTYEGVKWDGGSATASHAMSGLDWKSVRIVADQLREHQNAGNGTYESLLDEQRSELAKRAREAAQALKQR